MIVALNQSKNWCHSGANPMKLFTAVIYGFSL
jgi:hypothetical protein